MDHITRQHPEMSNDLQTENILDLGFDDGVKVVHLPFDESSKSGWSKIPHSQQSSKHSLFLRPEKVSYHLIHDEDDGSGSGNMPIRSFRVTVERRTPIGSKKLTCPKCSTVKRPITKTIAEKSTESWLFSKVIICCWPFCLTPNIFLRQGLEYIECRNCGHRFGVFDHQMKTFMSYQEQQENP